MTKFFPQNFPSFLPNFSSVSLISAKKYTNFDASFVLAEFRIFLGKFKENKDSLQKFLDRVVPVAFHVHNCNMRPIHFKGHDKTISYSHSNNNNI